MSGFIGIIAPQIKQGDSDILDRCQQEILACCDDYAGAWKSENADIRFGWLKTTDDTGTEELPYTIDQNIYIAGDVRLDNRQQLISLLAKQFTGIDITTPDVYLLLNAYTYWGTDCTRHICGDYAFAIWDQAASSLFCARDHFGMIPFYYSQNDEGFLFTNFYRSLKYVPGLMEDMDEAVLRSYFLSGLNFSEDKTLYTKIKKLPAAHQLTYKNGELNISQYWQMPEYVEPIRYKTTKEYVIHFYKLFEQSVSDRIRNQNTGCALSGGMDSSAVTAVSENILKKKYGPLHKLTAYNITYRHLVNENEGYFAKLTAQHLGIPIRQYIAEDYLANIGLPMDTWLPEPVGLPRASAEGQILADAASVCRIFLGGFGGDPLFEYDHDEWRRLIKTGHWLQPVKDTLVYYRAFSRLPPMDIFGRNKKKAKNAPAGNHILPGWMNKDFFSTGSHSFKNKQGSADIRSNFGMLNNPLWGNLFENSHPGFTGKKIKVRQPFFSLDLLLFLRAVPPHLLFQKSLLRMAMLPYLPENILRRPKTLLFGTPHFHNLKETGALMALKKSVLQSKDFLKDKIDIPALLSEIDDPENLKLKDHVKIITILLILAWKNFENQS